MAGRTRTASRCAASGDDHGERDARRRERDDGTDSEGIYTRGYGHLISGNLLVGAGRTQAKLTDGVGGFRFERDVITDTRDLGGRQGPIVIRTNEFAGVRGSSAVGVRASRTPPTGFRGADGRIYDDELGAVVPSAIAGIPPVAPGGDAVGTVVLEVPVTAIDGGKVFVESSLSLESQRAWWQ